MATFTDKDGLPTLTEGSLTGHDIVQNINAYNTGMIEFNDRLFADQATFQTYLLKSVIMTESIYSNKIFRGEIQDMRTSNQHVTYNVTDKARKLLKQQADYDPIKESGYFRQILGAVGGSSAILDADKLFGTASELDAHLLHFQRASSDRVVVSPNLINPPTTGVSAYMRSYSNGTSDQYKTDDGSIDDVYDNPVTPNGDLNDLYRGVPDGVIEPGDNEYRRWSAHFGATGGGGIAVQLDCYFSLKSTSSIEKLALEIELSCRQLSDLNLVGGTQQDPFIGLWDDTNNRYEVVYIRGGDIGGNRFISYTEDFSGFATENHPWVNKTADTDDNFAETISNYVTDIATTGAYSIKRVRMVVGTGLDTLESTNIALRTARLTIDLDTDQQPTRGVEEIASHTNTQLTFGDLGTDGESPLYDGCGQDDTYIITDILDNQISAIETAWGITINADITNSNVLAITRDHTYSTKEQVLQDIADVGNAAWWYDPIDDDYNIVSADKLDGSNATYQSGITITKDDIEDYHQPGAWNYSIDASNIADTLIIVGDATIGEITLTLSPEFSHSLGSEEVILERSDIHSLYHLNKLKDAERHKYEKARRTLTFTIDLDNPNQSYSALKIGSTIAVQLPSATDTSVCNHTTAGDGELLVTQLQWVKKPGSGNRRKVTVTAERRYS